MCLGEMYVVAARAVTQVHGMDVHVRICYYLVHMRARSRMCRSWEKGQKSGMDKGRVGGGGGGGERIESPTRTISCFAHTMHAGFDSVKVIGIRGNFFTYRVFFLCNGK